MMNKFEDTWIKLAKQLGWGRCAVFLSCAIPFTVYAAIFIAKQEPDLDWHDGGIQIIVLSTAALCYLAIWWYVRKNME